MRQARITADHHPSPHNPTRKPRRPHTSHSPSRAASPPPSTAMAAPQAPKHRAAERHVGWRPRACCNTAPSAIPMSAAPSTRPTSTPSRRPVPSRRRQHTHRTNQPATQTTHTRSRSSARSPCAADPIPSRAQPSLPEPVRSALPRRCPACPTAQIRHTSPRPAAPHRCPGPPDRTQPDRKPPPRAAHPPHAAQPDRPNAHTPIGPDPFPDASARITADHHPSPHGPTRKPRRPHTSHSPSRAASPPLNSDCPPRKPARIAPRNATSEGAAYSLHTAPSTIPFASRRARRAPAPCRLA